MTDITIDIDQFTQSIKDAVNRTQPWVILQPEKPQENETEPPVVSDSVPSVMTDFALVPSSEYRFSYAIRAAKFGYVLERGGSYETGVLSVVHDLPAINNAGGSEANRPAESAPFIPPGILFSHQVDIGGPLGVDFTFMHDDTTSGSNEKFGLAFKITTALPAKYPALTLCFITAFSQENI